MSTQMNHEAGLFLFSFGIGIFLSFIYSLLHIFRKLHPHTKTLLSLEDLIFWTGSSIYFFDKIYQKNDGIVRIYVFAAAIIGAWFWIQWIEPLYVTKILKLSKIIIKYLRVLIKWLLIPVKRCRIQIKKCLQPTEACRKNQINERVRKREK